MKSIFKQYMENLTESDIKKDKKKLSFKEIKNDSGGFISLLMKTPDAVSKSVGLFNIRDILNDRIKFDFDVYLPEYGRNLQREKQWTAFQQSEFIRSILHGKLIPEVLVIYNEKEKNYEVIDGKQRLLSIIEFLNNEFPVNINNENYYFKDFDDSLESSFLSYFIIGKKVLNPYIYGKTPKDDKFLTDENKLELFKFTNFAGTPIDKEYINSFNKKI